MILEYFTGVTLPNGRPEIRTLSPENPLPLGGNEKSRFRDGFLTKDTTKWTWPDESGNQQTRSRIDGNVAGCSYLVASLSALVAGGDEWDLVSLTHIDVPYELEFGMSLSQRIGGQEINVETVAVDENGVVIGEAEPTAVPLTGSVTVASNVWTFASSSNHNLRPGDWAFIYGASDSRLNIGPVILGSGTTGTTIVLTSTLANATYTLGAGAMIRRIHLAGGANYQVGYRWWGATAGNCDVYSRNGDPRGRLVALNPGNTQDAATVPNEGGLNYASVPYVQAFRSKGSWHLEHTSKRLCFRARDLDVTTADRSQAIRREPNPDPTLSFALRVRVKNHLNLTVPTAPITAAAKAGSTTATLTVPNHGLTTGDFIVVYGIRDQTNFANLTTATAVASVVDANNITIAFGASATATSYGGFVMRVNGGAIPSVQNVAVQTYNKTADGLRLVLVASGNWAETIGNTVSVYGLVDGTPTILSSLNGRYRVANQATTTLELEPLEGQDLTSVPGTATNAGGTVVRNTDLRLHYIRSLERARQEMDMSTAGAAVEPAPVQTVGTTSVSGTVTANIGTGSIAAGTNAIGDVGVQYRANNTGAATPRHIVSAASTNATNVKNAAGRLIGYQFINNATAVRYVKLHNSSTAPTAGAGVFMTIGIPPNGGKAEVTCEGGVGFSAGIGYTIVTGAADSDATAVAANDVVGELFYA